MKIFTIYIIGIFKTPSKFSVKSAITYTRFLIVNCYLLQCLIAVSECDFKQMPAPDDEHAFFFAKIVYFEKTSVERTPDFRSRGLFHLHIAILDAIRRDDIDIDIGARLFEFLVSLYDFSFKF